MKARTIATVAAAGLAVLVTGCRSKQPALSYEGDISLKNASACNNQAHVSFDAYGFSFFCGDAQLIYSGSNGFFLERLKDYYVDFNSDGKAEELHITHFPNEADHKKYNEILKDIGADEIGKIWVKWHNEYSLLGGSQGKMGEIVVNAPACNNKPEEVYFSSDYFHVVCGRYGLRHWAFEDNLTRGRTYNALIETDGANMSGSDFSSANTGTYFSEDTGDRILDRIVNISVPPTDEQNKVYEDLLKSMGAEEVKAQWEEWFSQQ
ncbi:MAG: hypothetical protein V1734_03775 [Nanoarchaeota archaeon]